MILRLNRLVGQKRFKSGLLNTINDIYRKDSKHLLLGNRIVYCNHLRKHHFIMAGGILDCNGMGPFQRQNLNDHDGKH
jgi:hypothetical protein